MAWSKKRGSWIVPIWSRQLVDLLLLAVKGANTAEGWSECKHQICSGLWESRVKRILTFRTGLLYDMNKTHVQSEFTWKQEPKLVLIISGWWRVLSIIPTRNFMLFQHTESKQLIFVLISTKCNYLHAPVNWAFDVDSGAIVFIKVWREDHIGPMCANGQ